MRTRLVLAGLGSIVISAVTTPRLAAHDYVTAPTTASRPMTLLAIELATTTTTAPKPDIPVRETTTTTVTRPKPVAPRVSRSAPPRPAPPAAPTNSPVAVQAAYSQLGKPYRWAASGPNSFDCSGLTMFVWRQAGVSLPHSSSGQYRMLPHIPVTALLPGDLVFFGRSVSHVGIYIGAGQMIHAPHSGQVVQIASINRGLIGAARP